jgi:hypothetical protein
MPIVAERTSAEGSAFIAATEEYLSDLYARQPVVAMRLGMDAYEGALRNRRSYTLDRDLRRARAYLFEIDRLPLVRMSSEARIQYHAARVSIQSLIAILEHINPWRNDPMRYIEEALACITTLPSALQLVENRNADFIIKALSELVDLLQAGEENLENPARVLTSHAIAYTNSAIELLKMQETKWDCVKVSSKKDLGVAEAFQRAHVAFNAHAEFLRAVLLGRSNGNLSFGADLFGYLLLLSDSSILEINVLERRLLTALDSIQGSNRKRLLGALLYLRFHCRKINFEEAVNLLASDESVSGEIAEQRTVEVIRSSIGTVIGSLVEDGLIEPRFGAIVSHGPGFEMKRAVETLLGKRNSFTSFAAEGPLTPGIQSV